MNDNSKTKLCICVFAAVILFIILSPGFLINIPADPSDADRLGNFASYAEFYSWRQTLVHAGIFGIILIIVCCCICHKVGRHKTKK
jgi:hypothetical protein